MNSGGRARAAGLSFGWAGRTGGDLMVLRRYGPTEVEPAAGSPAELGFLDAIMADQLAELPRLAYADWLEERGDPRGPFLREFVRVARDPEAEIPPGDEFPLPWRQVVGV